MRRRLVSLAVVACSVLLVPQAAGAWLNPTPGTPTQVAALVAKSKSITTLTKTVANQVPSSWSDLVSRLYPASKNPGCMTTSQCVYGIKTSKRVVVLFGDSHAAMWLPAIAPDARHAGVKLVVLWKAGCHVANINVYGENPWPAGGEAACRSWLTTEVGAIVKLHPFLVLIGERTTAVYAGPNNRLFTESQWQTGLQSTISKLKASGAKVAIVEDLVWENHGPGQCLSTYPTQVQKCSTPNPNLANPGQQVAERKAALATGSGFIPTTAWLCTTVCSAVVGNFITHWDEGHVSATYAVYLSGVMALALRPYLG